MPLIFNASGAMKTIKTGSFINYLEYVEELFIVEEQSLCKL